MNCRNCRTQTGPGGRSYSRIGRAELVCAELVRAELGHKLGHRERKGRVRCRAGVGPS